MNTRTIAYIQMGDFKKEVEVYATHTSANGEILISDKDGNEYRTHISNVVVMKVFGGAK